MATFLGPGANAPLAADEAVVMWRAGKSGPAHSLAVLPAPHGPQPWLPLQEPPPPYAVASPGGHEYRLRLADMPMSVETIYLVLYTSSAQTLMPLGSVAVHVGGYDMVMEQADLSVPSMVVAELYRRNGQWKVRAKKDGVFDGLGELARRLGVRVDDRTPSTAPGTASPSASPPPSAGRQGHADWTGSGSMVSDRFLVTNAHVVQNANDIWVSGFSGKSRADAVIVDEMNDLALLRLHESVGQASVVFRDGGLGLGETALTLGYPLSGLLGRGPQFTSGSVSNLLGPGDDARLVQITCPIQPGSSGGPVFDESGLVAAVVTATLSNAQNVNFAIRSSLALPLLDAAGVAYRRAPKGDTRAVAEIVRDNSPSVWRVECFA